LDDARLAPLGRFGLRLGTAFQIQDDVLNLRDEPGGYGKESCGDLWEGKRTLILLHAIRSAPARDAERARAIL
jgi:geranylgeranyl diphosphate synthase type II